MTRLHLAPISKAQADEFVARMHRHNGPVGATSTFPLAVVDDEGQIRGVAIVGRPIARRMDDGWTAEVRRTCTDGTDNANSMLYGAAWRAAKAMGYCRLITYTQESETGSSLRAAGFTHVHTRKARAGWSTPARQRDDTDYISTERWRWEITTAARPPQLPQLVDEVDDQPDLFGGVA